MASINYRGFSAYEDFITRMKSELLFFSEFCPDDSAIDVEINYVDMYQLSIAVHFDGGLFHAHGKGTIFERVFEYALTELYKQVKAWREHRFLIDEEAVLKNGEETLLQKTETEVSNQKPRVLIVDDEEDSVQLLKACLNTIGCDTTVVHSGREAVLEITSQNYDLIFLDWLMPDMDGIQTIEKAEWLNSRNAADDVEWSALKMPVVTYSSFNRERIRVPDCRHFRFVDHWSKTTPYAQLVTQTNRLLSDIQKEGPVTSC